MEKYIIEEHTGWEYELKGEQYYPTGRRIIDGVITPAERPEESPSEEEFIGPWALRHLNYLKNHRRGLFLELFASGKANDYLTGIDREASDLFLRLVNEMSAREDVTEQLKAEDQMLWVARMNSIRDRATEIVNSELIFA